LPGVLLCIWPMPQAARLAPLGFVALFGSLSGEILQPDGFRMTSRLYFLKAARFSKFMNLKTAPQKTTALNSCPDVLGVGLKIYQDQNKNKWLVLVAIKQILQLFFLSFVSLDKFDIIK